MASRRIESEIDRLYHLPPQEFTTARNLLAKQAGGDGAEVRALAKPPVGAWAVNQLFWKHRAVYDALIEASEAVRQTHKAVLGGKRGDLRVVGKAHEQAVETARKATVAIMAESGQAATDTTRQSIVTTLRALPVEGERPGRLTRVLQPGGFEMLAGLSIARGAAVKRLTAAPAAPPAGRASAPQKAIARARDAVARAEREIREAEQVARRQEFDAARITREAEKATRSLDAAREALDGAKQVLVEAEAVAASTAHARDEAERHSNEADRALEAARARADAANAALTRLND